MTEFLAIALAVLLLAFAVRERAPLLRLCVSIGAAFERIVGARAGDEETSETTFGRAELRSLDSVQVRNGLRGIELPAPLRLGAGGPETLPIAVAVLDRRLAALEKLFGHGPAAVNLIVCDVNTEASPGPFATLCFGGCGRVFTSSTAEYKCHECVAGELERAAS